MTCIIFFLQHPHDNLIFFAGATNFNFYPRKKELERQMASTQNELNKSHKELNSLHQMMQTYQKQPKFGDSKKFQKDIQRAEIGTKQLEDR